MKSKIRALFSNRFFLLVLAILLFWQSHPNGVFKNGLGLLGFFIYVPVFLLIDKTSLKNAWLFGGLYGAFSYFLLAFWLTKYHFLTLILVCMLYFFYCGLLFTVLKIAQIVSNGAITSILFLLISCAYEYLITTGFLGFSYGVTAYTQWKFIPFIQSASLAGVFGLNLLIIGTSLLVYSFIKAGWTSGVKRGALIWGCLFAANLIFGAVSMKVRMEQSAGAKKLSVIAVQNNESPWKNGIEEHKKNLSNLMQISDFALSESGGADFVIWPETAVAPSVMRHFYEMRDMDRLSLIVQLLNYINGKSSVFVIGNAHEELDEKGEKKIFNNALVFEAGKNVIPPEPDMYTKMHLVPISESFPFEHLMPHLYKKLLQSNTHFWEKGADYSVFTYKELSFSTPICFEDTFGNDCRKFVKNGARCFMNLSNDAWSESLACQTQHLSMAVFRSAENKVPSVRSTTSGQTCIINSCGQVVKAARPFCQDYVDGTIPILENFKPSLYTRFGDYAGICECAFAGLLLIIKGIICIIKKIRGIHG